MGDLYSSLKLAADRMRRLSSRGNEKVKTDDNAVHQSFFFCPAATNRGDLRGVLRVAVMRSVRHHVVADRNFTARAA